MPLLDGKYEIIREHQLAPGQTLFEAAAPDGTALRIVWYDIAADQERSFEKYRRGVRQLRKAGLAAVHDVVSRPGAHYVAWQPANGSRPAPPDAALVDALAAAGFRVEDADIRRGGRRVQVYGLAWDGAPVPTFSGPPPTPTTTAAILRRRRQAVQRAVSPRKPLSQALVTNVLAGSLLLVASLLLLSAFLIRNAAAVVTVPDVAGRNVTQAVALLSGMGLVPEPLPEASDAEPGTVLRASLAAGASVPRGSAIRVSYAFPPGQARPATVPTLIGRSYPADVQGLMQSSGLQLGAVARINSTVPAGTVLAQSEVPGATVGSETRIDLLVSAGESIPTTLLPDLTGLTVDAATTLAELAGIRAEQIVVDEAEDPMAQPGTVLAQLPPTEEPVALLPDGVVLTLTVAAGSPDAVQMPSFIGLTEAQARARAAGYQVTVTAVSDPARPEGVVEQRPEEGAWTDGGPLELVVNTRPQPIPVPQPIVEVRSPTERSLAYDWFIEPGIGEQTARVYAIDLDGLEQLVSQRQVQGGQRVQGTFDTNYPGVITFRLTLNNEPYGDLQRAR